MIFILELTSAGQNFGSGAIGGSPPCRSRLFLGGAWAGCCQEREDGLGWIELPAPSQD